MSEDDPVTRSELHEQVRRASRNAHLRAAATAAGVTLIIVLALLVGVAWARATNQRDATGQQGKTLADQVRLVCQQGGAAARQLGSACSQASKIVATPVVGETTHGPAVATYHVRIPGATVTETLVTVSVRPGRTSTVPGSTSTLLIPVTQTETTTETQTETQTATTTVTETHDSGGTSTVTVTSTEPGATETTTEPGPTTSTTTTVTTTPTCVIGIAC